MAKREEDMHSVEMPKRGQSSGNLETRTIRTKDKRFKAVKAPKPVQLNLKVPAKTKADFDAAFEASGIPSKAQFVAALVSLWNEHEGEKPAASEPNAQDVAHGRTEVISGHVSPQVATYINQRAIQQSWPVGVVIEDAIAEVITFRRNQRGKSVVP